MNPTGKNRLARIAANAAYEKIGTLTDAQVRQCFRIMGSTDNASTREEMLHEIRRQMAGTFPDRLTRFADYVNSLQTGITTHVNITTASNSETRSKHKE